jgi:hypothetical protein
MTLAPFALSVVILIFWSALGWSVIAATEPKIDPLRALMLAPAVGVAATALPVFWLSLVGLPVTSFARPLLVALCLVSMTAWILRRPAWKLKDAACLLPVIVAIAVFGYPSFKYGFDWVANANDDWGNYNLRAIRFLSDGFFQRPELDVLKNGGDYPGYFWFMDVASNTRPGSDLVLAFLSANVGKSPFMVFMPLILAFYAVFCFAAAGMAASMLDRRVLIAALVLMALAPLSHYAIHQQLIGQVIGLGFMCATASLTFVPFYEFKSKGRIVLAGVTMAGFWLCYPETVPIFGLAFLVFHILHIRDSAWGWSLSWRVVQIPLFSCVLIGPYTVGFITFLLEQASGSATQGVYEGISIFPYFRVPTGLSVLFGFSRLGEILREPLLSASIAGAIFMVGLVLAGMAFDFRKARVISAHLVVVILLAIGLILSHNDFGVFKTAMFAQAFIWFAVILTLSKMRKQIALPIFVTILVALVSTDLEITKSSVSAEMGSATALPGASKDHLLTKVLEQRLAERCDANYSTSSPPLIKLLSAERGCAKSFIGRPNLFAGFAAVGSKDLAKNPLRFLKPPDQFTEQASTYLKPELIHFQFPNDAGEGTVDVYKPNIEFKQMGDTWSLPSVVGNGSLGMADDLIFLSSSLGCYFYLPDFTRTTLYETEPDTFFAGGKFAGVGRYLLFRVASPTKSVRLVLDLTTSILADGNSKLPPASVIGGRSVAVGLVGRGAARVISPPFSPLSVDGISYVLLDLGAEAKPMKTPRPGLSGLYGNDVAVDYRRLVAFARAIRLVDAASANLPLPPRRISTFPSDLADPGLEFSGIYEDGWVGDRGFVTLHSATPGRAVIRGAVPAGIGMDNVDVMISVGDGAPVRKSLKPGPFVISAPAEAGTSRVNFEFTNIGRLPPGDDRPAAALLASIGIEAREDSEALNTPRDMANTIEQSSGIYWDGWTATVGSMTVKSSAPATLLLRGSVSHMERQQVIIGSNATSIRRQELREGPFEIRVPIEAGKSKVNFAFSRDVQLPDDQRRVSVLLTAATIEYDGLLRPVNVVARALVSAVRSMF